jgi:hypothetical protein
LGSQVGASELFNVREKQVPFDFAQGRLSITLPKRRLRSG